MGPQSQDSAAAKVLSASGSGESVKERKTPGRRIRNCQFQGECRWQDVRGGLQRIVSVKRREGAAGHLEQPAWDKQKETDKDARDYHKW